MEGGDGSTMSLLREGTSQAMHETFLPEDLVIKVVAAVPYPEIIQARCLSKRWRHLLTSDSPEADVRDFQDQVGFMSSTWPSFAPVVQCGERLRGYDPVGRNWRDLTSPSAQSAEERMRGDETRDAFEETVLRVECSGSMVCYFESICKYRRRDDGNSYVYAGAWHRMKVVNIITGNLKFFRPPSLTREGVWWTEEQFFSTSRRGFLIVQLYANRAALHLDLAVHVFDSKVGSWSSHYIQELECVSQSRDVERRVICYSNLVDHSILHLFARDYSAPILGRLNCSTGAWSHTSVSQRFASLVYKSEVILMCGSRVLIVCVTPQERSLWLGVFEYVEELGQIKILDPAHKVASETCSVELKFSSDKEHIYVGVFLGIEMRDKLVEVLSFDVTHRVWECLPDCSLGPQEENGVRCDWVLGLYSPGVNPFCKPSLVPDQSA